MKSLVVLVSSLAIATLASACSIGSPVHLTYIAPDDDSTTSTASVTTTTCSSPFVAVDVSTLMACKNGEGHCYDKTKVPAIGDLTACTGDDACVPDSVLTLNGGMLKTCNSVIDKPGACVSLAIDAINDKASQLTQDVCAANERCVPCIDPLDNTPTPFCVALGVHQDACVTTSGASTATAPQPCCVTEGAPPQGTCMSADNVPPSSQGKVSQDVCPSGDACVPSSFVNNDPVMCSSTLGSGFCVDECFTGVLGSRALLRGDCPNLLDKCVPCSVGAAEGLPGCD